MKGFAEPLSAFLGGVPLPPLPANGTGRAEQTGHAMGDRRTGSGRWTPAPGRGRLWANKDSETDVYVYVHVGLRGQKEKRRFLLVTVPQENLMTVVSADELKAAVTVR